MKSLSIAAGPGYAYNLVVSPFYLTGLVAFSLGYQQTRYVEDGNRHTTGNLAPNFHLRLGLGVNSRRFFLTANFFVDRFTQQTRTLEIGNDISGLTLSLGMRF